MLTIHDVSMWYRGAPDPILAQVEVFIPGGEIVPVLGDNGVGKTTLLKIVCGIAAPTTGSVRVGERDTIKQSVEARSVIGVSMYPERSFYYRLTCQQNLRYYASLRNLFGSAAKQEIRRVLTAVELLDLADTAFMRLSLGQRKRLGLARCLLGRPHLLVLDEPTANLDADSVTNFYRVMAEHRAAGGLVLFSTHQMADLSVATGRFLRIQDRRVYSVEVTAASEVTRSVHVITPNAKGIDLSAIESRYTVRHTADGFSIALPVSVALPAFVTKISELGVLIEQVLDDRWCEHLDGVGNALQEAP
jgi:heme ABC exporter ATP-binding subunit CcmA